MTKQRRTPTNYHPTQWAFLPLQTNNAPRFKLHQIQVRGHILPPFLKQARDDLANNHLPRRHPTAKWKKVHFTNKFKYIGSLITPLLNEDSKIEARIKKKQTIMSASKFFFNNKDIDKRVKSEIFVAGPLNALLWGCELWNLTKQNLNKITAFHHSPIRQILRIWWHQVKEKHIKNKEVRGLLHIIPNVDACITKRTATYLGVLYQPIQTVAKRWFLTP